MNKNCQLIKILNNLFKIKIV